MQDKLEQIKQEALDALDVISDISALEAWQVKYLGRSSSLMEVFKSLGTLSKEKCRPQVPGPPCFQKGKGQPR